MSELQSTEDEVIENDIIEEVEEVIDEVEDETEDSADHDDGSDLAPDNGDDHEKNTLDDHAQEAVNKRISKLTFEARQAQREKEQLEARLKQLEQQNAPKEPQVPEPPDPFDHDYEQKLQDWTNKLRERAEWDAKQKIEESRRQEEIQRQAQQQAMELTSKVDTYASRAKEAGIRPEELREAGNIVASYRLNDEVALSILDDDQGPLITTYLAKNYHELEEVSRLSPYKAALYIDKNIKPKLAGLKPRETNAPKPHTSIGTKIVDKDAGKYAHIKGATFE